jgi:D-aspartate ligase
VFAATGRAGNSLSTPIKPRAGHFAARRRGAKRSSWLRDAREFETFEPKSVGAIVLGGDYNGLGIVRSLGRQGVPIVVIDDEPSISRFSRYTVRNVRVGSLRDEEAVLESLLQVGSNLGLSGWLVFATRDEIVAAISRRRDELSKVFRVPTPPWDVVRWAWDKRLTYSRAGELGIPTPRTWHGLSAPDLASIATNVPLVVKPAIKEHFIYVTKVKAWRADTRDQLDEFFSRALAVIPAEEILVQELVPGDGACQFSYCAFFKNGVGDATMTVRRTRQHPPEFGRSSTFVETVDVPELVTYSERFLASIDYYGLVEMEYKLDRRDGKYKLLDVNPRTWGYHSLGSAAGTDFPFALYRDQLDEPLPASHATSGVSWFRLSTDLACAVGELARGGFDLRGYLRTLRATDVEAVFQRDDWVPGIAEIALLPYLYKTRGASRVVRRLTRDG